MTLSQLEYVLAVDTHRHFADAANACFVTQPTLSMQLQKLEKELGFKIFDRSKQPVVPTATGLEIIEQARRIIHERNLLTEIVEAKKGIINGELSIGIIPTLAPYLLPMFIHLFTKKYPDIRLMVSELTTELIVGRLQEGKVDVGILITPLQEKGIKEYPLFYEELMVYLSKANSAYNKRYILPKDIDPTKLWLLEEGHCFRSQIINLCELRPGNANGGHFKYETGSFETLRRMVDLYEGITVLPELATASMSAGEKAHLRSFKSPVPVRQVSLATHHNYVKKRLVDVLKKEILTAIPAHMKASRKQQVVPVS